MSARSFLSIVSAVAAFYVLGGGAIAQVVDPALASSIRLRGLKAESIRTPDYSPRVPGVSTSSPKKEWLQVGCEYDVAPDWIDEITFTYHVLLKARSAKDVGPAGKQFNLFRGQVTYVNVPKGNKLKSAIYLDPNTFFRYGAVERVAVQVSMMGQVIATESVPVDRDAWWERAAPMSHPLLPHTLTPFREVNPDEFGTVKPAVVPN